MFDRSWSSISLWCRHNKKNFCETQKSMSWGRRGTSWAWKKCIPCPSKRKRKISAYGQDSSLCFLCHFSDGLHWSVVKVGTSGWVESKLQWWHQVYQLTLERCAGSWIWTLWLCLIMHRAHSGDFVIQGVVNMSVLIWGYFLHFGVVCLSIYSSSLGG